MADPPFAGPAAEPERVNRRRKRKPTRRQDPHADPDEAQQQQQQQQQPSGGAVRAFGGTVHASAGGGVASEGSFASSGGSLHVHAGGASPAAARGRARAAGGEGYTVVFGADYEESDGHEFYRSVDARGEQQAQGAAGDERHSAAAVVRIVGAGSGEAQTRPRKRAATGNGALADAMADAQRREREAQAAAWQSRRKPKRAKAATPRTMIVLVASVDGGVAPAQAVEIGSFRAQSLERGGKVSTVHQVCTCKFAAVPTKSAVAAEVPRAPAAAAAGGGASVTRAISGRLAPAVPAKSLLLLQDAGRLTATCRAIAGSSTADTPAGQRELHVMLTLQPAGFIDLAAADDSSSAAAVRKLAAATRALIEWLYPETFSPPQPSTDQAAEEFDPRSLYTALSATHRGGKGTTPPDRPQHPGLKSTLRPYQRAASEWMIEREHTGGRGPAAGTPQLHPLWSTFEPRGHGGHGGGGGGGGGSATAQLYYHPLGYLSHSQPADDTAPILGGVLADEMGLGDDRTLPTHLSSLACPGLSASADSRRCRPPGKTCELLYCVLHHPAPPEFAQAKSERAAGGSAAGTSSAGQSQQLWAVCDSTDAQITFGNWWHKIGADNDLCDEAYHKTGAASQEGGGWVKVDQLEDLGQDCIWYEPAALEGGAALVQQDEQGELEQVMVSVLEVLKNCTDGTTGTQRRRRRRRAELFLELPSRQMYPDYYELIAKPVSFDQIEARIRGGRQKYKAFGVFGSDVKLLFDNAKQYNADGSEPFNDAVLMAACFAAVTRPCQSCGNIPAANARYCKAGADDAKAGSGLAGMVLDQKCWLTLDAAAQATYELARVDDGVHMELQCSLCRCVRVDSLREEAESADWYCRSCEAELFSQQELIKSRATLIVCPSSICQQWYSELKKHVSPGHLQVSIYNGIRDGYVSARVLASKDVVITTYDALRQDVYHSKKFQGGSTDRSRRFVQVQHPRPAAALPTPIIALPPLPLPLTTGTPGGPNPAHRDTLVAGLPGRSPDGRDHHRESRRDGRAAAHRPPVVRDRHGA